MKPTLLLALCLLCGTVKAQDKRDSTNRHFHIAEKRKHIFTIQQYETPLLIVEDPKRNKNGGIDSIIMHVKKSQLHWINDSTAIIKKL